MRPTGLALVSIAVLVALLLPGCGRWARPSSAPPLTLVVALVDLQSADLGPEGAAPALADLAANGVIADDVLAEACGGAALLALLGRPDPLTGDPHRTGRTPAKGTLVLTVPPSLRSEPELASLRDVRRAPATLPTPQQTLALVQRERPRLVIVALDPLQPTGREFRIAPGSDRRAAIADIDARLAAWIRALRSTDRGAGARIVLAGLPRSPRRGIRGRITPERGQRASTWQVPVVWWEPDSRSGVLSTPLQLRDVLAPTEDLAFSPPRVRTGRWWNAYGGGLWAEFGGAALTWSSTGDERVLEGLDRPEPRVARRLRAAARPATGDLWFVVRGSADADLLRMQVSGSDSLQPWGVEEIDDWTRQGPGSWTGELGAEPQMDGARLPLGPRGVELRIGPAMEEASVLGIEFFAAGTAVGLSTLRLVPYSRPYWIARQAPRPASMDAFWPGARVGVHVWVLDEEEREPSPPPFD